MSSRSTQADKDSERMAISYATKASTQTLPSIRELLPPHLHAEIESISHFNPSRQQQPHGRPVSSSQETFCTSRISSSSKAPRFDEHHNDYHIEPISHEKCQSSSSAEHAQLQESTVHYTTSRGPSPMLPPIRDLQTLPEHSSSGSGKSFSDMRGRPLLSSSPAELPAFSPSQPHPRHPEAYLESSPQPLWHMTPSYTPPGMKYSGGDMEPTSLQLLSHPPPPSHLSGALGDSMDSKSKRRRGNLPKPVTDILRAWFHDHLDHPYPSEEDKQMFMTRTGLSISQISNWFINARRRQLPALRNQMRSCGSDETQRPSPSLSDVESTN